MADLIHDDAVADLCGTTRERIRRIEAAAMQKLRNRPGPRPCGSTFDRRPAPGQNGSSRWRLVEPGERFVS